MANERFPLMEIRHGGGDTFEEVEIFWLSLPQVDSAVFEGLRKTMEAYLQGGDQKTRVNAFEEATKSAQGTLAIVAALCDTCPVKIHGDCTGMQSVKLSEHQYYEALLTVCGIRASGNTNAALQVEGNKCGVTASVLNDLHPVKM